MNFSYGGRGSWRRIILMAFLLTVSVAAGLKTAHAQAPDPAESAKRQAADVVVTGLAIIDIYMIQSGELALRSASSPATKAVAQKLVVDAKADYESIKHAALAAGSPLPTSVDFQRRQFLRKLRGTHAAQFDELFAAQQLAAARNALTIAKGYAQSGTNHYLQEHSVRAIPHLTAAIGALEKLHADLS